MLSRSSRTQTETKQTEAPKTTPNKIKKTQKHTKLKQNQAPSNDVTGTSLWVKRWIKEVIAQYHHNA